MPKETGEASVPSANDIVSDTPRAMLRILTNQTLPECELPSSGQDGQIFLRSYKAREGCPDSNALTDFYIYEYQGGESMKKSLAWLMFLGVLLLIGCASKKDADEKNFSEALNSYLAKKGQLCLGIPSTWPVDLNEAERRSGMGTAAEMVALEKAGLVRSHETETEYTQPLSSRPVRTEVLRYEMTENGKTFYREKHRLGLGANKEVQGDLCFGQQVLDTIVRWEGPTAAGDSKHASVFYTYRVENLAEWAKTQDIQRVFPGIVSTIDGAGKTVMNQALTLTSRGWEANGLDNPL
jgi:hypothetical protein